MHSGLPSQKLLENGARLASKSYQCGYRLSAWRCRRRLQTRSMPARAPPLVLPAQKMLPAAGCWLSSAGSSWSRDPALPERRMITTLLVVILGKRNLVFQNP